MSINLGTEFEKNLLAAVGVDLQTVEAGSISIDMVPIKGNATVRYTGIASIDATALRQLIYDAGQPPDVLPS